MSIAALFLALLLFDAQNLLSRCRRVLRPSSARSDDFTVLLPIYGDARYFANVEYALSLRPNVVLVVNATTAPMRAFADAQEADGWRVHRTHLEQPSPPAMILDALESDLVTTTYVVRMDADSYADQDLGRAIAAAAAADADLCSVKVVAANSDRLIERLQAVEYEMAMLARHVRPWLTSGGCMFGKTTVLRRILRLHSLWFYGEDMETGIVAKRLRLRVLHVDFRVYTTVPSTLGAWLKQRRGWWAGSFRQAFVNVDHMVRYPTWLAYNLGLIWLLLAGKLGTIAETVALLPWIILIYTGVTAAANWQVRSRWMIVYPYYALAQVLLLPLVGAVYYAYLATKTRRAGRYRIPPLGRITDVGRTERAAGSPSRASAPAVTC